MAKPADLDALAGAEIDVEELKFKENLATDLFNQLKSHIVDKFEAVVAREPNRPFVIYDDNIYSYQAMDEMACRVANVAKSWGLKAGDCASVMFQNEPAFIWTFLGFQKLGISSALINHNLHGNALVHSIMAADSKVLIVGSEFVDAVSDVLPQLRNLRVFVQGGKQKVLPEEMSSLDQAMLSAFPFAVSPTARLRVSIDDTCCYIYTSGTTGNPKPVIISHQKYLGLCILPRHLIQLSSDDITYVVLPLYHSTGMLLGVGAAIVTASCIVLRKKFSAQHFWADCRRHKVTNFIYIGELLRYLLTQPKSENDGVHNIRAVYGAGLRPDIWDEVKERFKLPKIIELYGATEAYTALFNHSQKPGVVGRLSPFLARFDPHKKVLVEYDVATAQPIRDKNGRCIPVPIGKPGLLLSKVPDNMMNKKLYKSAIEDTEKKLVRDCFAPGDTYMNYGDSLVMDKEFNLYFNDRLGDTFRWKGENVSTTEVANCISSLPFIEDASVYGVEIPGNDGKAGMAAVTLNPNMQLGSKELKELYEHVCRELPSYARPLFLRLLPKAIITGTFKNRKVELTKEGYDLNVVKDGLFFIDRTNKAYSRLDHTSLSKFISSRL